MSENTYDLHRAIEAIRESPSSGVDFTVFSVGTNEIILTAFDTDRDFIIIQNDGNSVLYIKLGIGVSPSSYSFRLEGTAKASIDQYGGVITAIRTSATENVMVTIVT